MQTARGASLNDRDDTGPSGGRPRSRRRRLRLFAGVAVLAYAVDVVTKIIAVDQLADRPPVTVVPGVLDLALVRNPGAAFSMATGLTAVLSVIALAVCVVVVKMAGRLRDPLWALALGLMLGGALGNLTDRILREPAPFRGHVVDFLALPHWPVFNVADSCVCLAAVLIVVQSFRGIGLDGRTEDSRGRHSTHRPPGEERPGEPGDGS
ncbi:MAG: signal peptidase II [Nocardioidaceae bacterium]